MLFDFHLSFWSMLFWLIWGHVVSDFALQSDFMANAKNHTTPIGKTFWKHVLPAHAIIHGGFVALFTGFVFLGVLEAIIHAIIDRMKCSLKISLDTDQQLHFLCKILWAVLAVHYGR